MFQGVFTALITPFTRDGKIDEQALRKLIDFQIDNGIDGLVPVGTTGESPTLSPEETEQVIRVVVEQAKGRVPVIAGTGSNCTDKAIHMTEKAKALGATASHRRCGRPAHGRVQHPGQKRQEHRESDHAQAGGT